VQAKLKKTRQDLENLRQLLSLYIKELKIAKADAKKRLKAFKSRVISLEKDLEVAQQFIKERKIKLISLKLNINNNNKRVRLLKAQLFKISRLI
jgi:chromosome segregation ATPase